VPRVSEEHLAARRQQIAEAAAALFAERGFSRTTMADLVAASGLSTGAVYRYFPSKADLVLAVVAGRDGTVGGQFTDEPPAELLARLAGYVAPGHGAAHARLIAQIWGDAAVTPELATAARASHERLEAHLADLLGRHRPGPTDAGDDAEVARVALAALVGLSALVAADIPVEVDGFVRVLSRLLG
jgi:AcrR family transcriptional regulator